MSTGAYCWHDVWVGGDVVLPCPSRWISRAASIARLPLRGNCPIFG